MGKNSVSCFLTQGVYPTNPEVILEKMKRQSFVCSRHVILESQYETVYPDSRVTARQFFSLFASSNYGITCQTKWYQPAVSADAFISRPNSSHVSSFINALF